MEAVFKTQNEHELAQVTLDRYNLTFSEFCRHVLCYQRLPVHSADFPSYKVAVQFYWMQARILDNLRYLKNQAKLGRIEGADILNLEAAISENQQISKAVLQEIWAMQSPQGATHLLKAASSSKMRSS
jgi:hypothetical protein